MKSSLLQLLKCAERLAFKYSADNFGFTPGDEPTKIEPPFENGDLVEIVPRGIKAIYLNIAPWAGAGMSYVHELGRKVQHRSYNTCPTKDLKLLQKKYKSIRPPVPSEPETIDWDAPLKSK